MHRAFFAVSSEIYLGFFAVVTANGIWNRDTVTMIPSLRMVVALRGVKLGAFEPAREDGAANLRKGKVNQTILIDGRGD